MESSPPPSLPKRNPRSEKKKIHHAVSILYQNIVFSESPAKMTSLSVTSMKADAGSQKTSSSSAIFSSTSTSRRFAPVTVVEMLCPKCAQGKKDGKSKNAYFPCLISSNVETKEIVNQLGLEFSRLGNFLRVKELQVQAVHTTTPVVCLNIHISTQKYILAAELEACLVTAQDDYRDNFDAMQDGEYWDITHGSPPKVNLCLNLPNIPKQKAPATSKMPGHMAACRKVWHLEVDAAESEKLKTLLNYAKRKGIFKES
jgi:hypothetical protein